MVTFLLFFKGGEYMEKKPYEKPQVKAIKIENAVMVAASRSGMGACKITFVS